MVYMLFFFITNQAGSSRFLFLFIHSARHVTIILISYTKENIYSETIYSIVFYVFTYHNTVLQQKLPKESNTLPSTGVGNEIRCPFQESYPLHCFLDKIFNSQISYISHSQPLSLGMASAPLLMTYQVHL